MYKQFIWILFIAFFSTVLLSSCSEIKETPQKTVVQLYNDGMTYMQNKDYGSAAKSFRQLALNYPYSKWAARGLLLSGYAEYLNDNCAESINSLDEFIQLYPTHKSIAYAYYLRGVCYYEHMSDVSNDQTSTQKALDYLNDLITSFPNTKFAADALLKKDVLRNQLAGKDLYVGRFYENKQLYTSAILRYQHALDTYKMSPQIPESLYRLVESYYALGLFQESVRSLAVLGFNYPHSIWYRKGLNFKVIHSIPENATSRDAPSTDSSS